MQLRLPWEAMLRKIDVARDYDRHKIKNALRKCAKCLEGADDDKDCSRCFDRHATRLGRGRGVWAAGRRDQRHHGGLAQAPGRRAVRPRPPRGSRRVHGLCLCQGDRQAGRVPRHLRTGRHPLAERAVRREAGRAARARHHRAGVPRPDQYAAAARRRARQGVHGRGGVQPAHHEPGPRAAEHRPGDPPGVEAPGGEPYHDPVGHAGRRDRRAHPAQRPGPCV